MRGFLGLMTGPPSFMGEGVGTFSFDRANGSGEESSISSMSAGLTVFIF